MENKRYFKVLESYVEYDKQYVTWGEVYELYYIDGDGDYWLKVKCPNGELIPLFFEKDKLEEVFDYGC